MNNIFEDFKPTIVWAGCLVISNIEQNLNVIAGVVSIGYTLYKIISDIKKNKNV